RSTGLRRFRPRGPRPARAATSRVRLRSASLSRVPAGAARGPDRASGRSRALANDRGGGGARRVARFAGAARHGGDAPARKGVKASQDHLPAKLWWVLAGLTFAWGFNWTAM